MPDRLAIDPAYPVKFDGEHGEYWLVGDGDIALMYFCFSCGGRLPESKRSTLFTTPTDADVAAVTRIIAQLKSVEDAVRLLGQPDERYDAPPLLGADWNRTLRYSSRWESLFLDVQELPDGTTRCIYGGRYIGLRERAPAEKNRWWHFWRRRDTD
jgi:hypothetical protein